MTITQVNSIGIFKKLFDCSPCDMENYTEVNQEEFKLFLNDYAPDNLRMSHCGGKNYSDKQGNPIAFSSSCGRKYYVHNTFIKKYRGGGGGDE